MKAGIEHWYRWNSSEVGLDAPSLDFLPSRARRRLSRLSRAVLEVGHHLCGLAEPEDVLYASRYGETARQLEITRGLLDENEVSPSTFSYSVFNTPVALLSQHENLRGKTRAVFGGACSFSRGLMQAVLCRNESQKMLYLFGDECKPGIYLNDGEAAGPTDVIGIILGPADGGMEVVVESSGNDRDDGNETAVADLTNWLERGSGDMVFSGAGYDLKFSRNH